MAMATLTLWQLVGISCAYLFVTVGLPAFAFGKKLCGHRAPERFILYFMTGNFFVMNLVYALQLLKISYPATLILGTLLAAIIARIKVNHIPVKETFLDFVENFRRLAGGQMGIKTAVYKIGVMLREVFLRFCRWISYFLFQRFWDCVLTLLLLAALWYIYGTNLVEYYGYKASDVLVHNYWINAMGENNIFVAGVYPYGFHCIIYYLHAVFGVETFVLLRIFAFVSNVMMHLTILCVLRLCCRSKYAAYVGSYAYALGKYFNIYTYNRFYATLPQEFGIIFILPAIYFGFAFFETRRQELKAGKKKKALDSVEEAPEAEKPETEKAEAEKPVEGKPAKKGKALLQKLTLWFGKKGKALFTPSGLCLAGFCMSFSMTLSVHFYGTIVAGVFCFAMACGYWFLFVRKQYFGKIVITTTLSVILAILPMFLAFIGGTRLEGSLLWAVGVIQSSGSQKETVVNDSPAQGSVVGGSTVEESASSGAVPGESAAGGETQGEVSAGTNGGEMPVSEQKERVDITERISRVWEEIKRIWVDVERVLRKYVFYFPFDNGIYWVMMSFLGLIGLGCFYILVRKVCYGAMLVSTGLHMLFMCVMMDPRAFRLPALMDQNRGGIYFTYFWPVAVALVLDGVLYLPFSLLRGKVQKVGKLFLNGLSLACVVVFLYCIVVTGQVKTPAHTEGQEMNDAVVCLSNIIKNENNFTWTIISANDEGRMGSDYGYHYETITFLREMENAPTDTLIRIPTRVVYFFVEKIPIDYNVPYYDSGQSISEEGAAYVLPGGAGISAYQGRNRWVLMSRLYSWAETFRRLFPNEMDIYMETDRFICYRVEQEPYRLYNFALDYGYNHWGFVAE